MSAKRSALKAAKEALAAKDYKEAVQQCKAALKEDRSCYEAYVFIGKAAFHLGEFPQSELAYQKAIEINERGQQAWQGRSELYWETKEWAKAAEAYEELVEFAQQGAEGLASKLPFLSRRLAEAHIAAGDLDNAELVLQDLLGHRTVGGHRDVSGTFARFTASGAADSRVMNLAEMAVGPVSGAAAVSDARNAPVLSREERLSLLCLLADVQLKEDEQELEQKVSARLHKAIHDAGGDVSRVNEAAEREAVLAEAADEALELELDHATSTLKEIVCNAPPTPPYAKYYDAYLLKLRRAMQVAPPGTMDRHQRRVAVLDMCRLMMDGITADSAGVGRGCASQYAYETALRLLEVEEDVTDGAAPQTPAHGLSSQNRSISHSALMSPARIMSRISSGAVTPNHHHTTAYGASPKVGSFFTSQGNLDAMAASQAAGPYGPFGGPANADIAATLSRNVSQQRLSSLTVNPMSRSHLMLSNASQSALVEMNSSTVHSAQPSGPATPNATAATPLHANGPPSATAAAAANGGSNGVLQAAVARLPALPRLTVPTMSRGASSEHLQAMGSGSAAAPGLLSPVLNGLITPRKHAPPLLLLRDTEMITKRLAHAFPWSAAAQVHVAMSLRRHEAYIATHSAAQRLTQGAWMDTNRTDLALSDEGQQLARDPGHRNRRRRQLARLLDRGLKQGVTSVAAFIALAQLRLDCKDAAGALEAAKAGIKFVYDRSRSGKERMRHGALVLNLLAAQAMLGVGDVETAGRVFFRLAARVSEGEVAFGELVGMGPVSIRQQAVRGLAKVALAKGDRCQAQHNYEELVAKAMMGRGTAEPWAYAEYGWLLFEDGNIDSARMHLETAIEHLNRQGLVGQEQEAAEYHYKLGRVYWAQGGEFRDEREYAYAQFLEAASSVDDGPWTAPAFAALGDWYHEVAHDAARARKCYQRALALDDALETAGDGLLALLETDPADAPLQRSLCEELAARPSQPQWAQRRLAQLRLQAHEYEGAITAFQAAIRAAPDRAELWEGLGSAYHGLGRHSSALKSYGRALELEPGRVYCLMQSAQLEYQVASYAAAAARYRAVLAAKPGHVAALLGLAEVLLAAARQHGRLGALGAAAHELAEAAEAAAAAAAAHGNLATAWKLLGDVHVQHSVVNPKAVAEKLAAAKAAGARGAADAAAAAKEGVAARLGEVRRARRAYAAAVHLNPTQGTLWGDIATTLAAEAGLLRLQPGCSASRVAVLHARAEAIVRGGLRLAPSSGWLWACLGRVVGDPAKAEVAWGHALQLQPRDAITWAELGRVYSRNGAGPQARKCFDMARSVEPTLVAIWEAMAAESGRAGQAGRSEMLDNFEHAVGLGGGLESWMGYSAGAIAAGRANEGVAFAAASKAAEQQPLLAAAHNALGLAYEARQQHADAALSYELAAALLQPDPLSMMPGVAAATAPPFFTVQLPPGASTKQPQAAAQLNLARALARSGQHSRAVQLYTTLQSRGMSESDPHAWIALAHAQACSAAGDSPGAPSTSGQPEGTDDACTASLNKALSVATASGDGSAALHAVTALVRHQLTAGRREAAFELLLTHGTDLGAEQGPPGGAQCILQLWLALVAACVVGADTSMEVQSHMVLTQWAATAAVRLDGAALAAALASSDAAREGAAGHRLPALRRLAAAVHACPWDLALRTRLAAGALAGSQRLAQAALRAVAPPAVQSPRPVLAATVRASGLVSCTAVAVTEASEAEERRLRALLHVRPNSALLWYLQALVAFQRAIGSGQAWHYRAALACCKGAAARLKAVRDARQRSRERQQAPRRGSLELQHEAKPGLQQRVQSASCHGRDADADEEHAAGLPEDERGLMELLVRVMAAQSECELRVRLPGAADAAHQLAMDALGMAMSAQAGVNIARRQVARMLAQAQMLPEAEAAYRQAAASGDAVALLELARLLQRLGRAKEGAELLNHVRTGGGLLATQGQQQGQHKFPEAVALEEALTRLSIGDLQGAKAAAAAAIEEAGRLAGDSAPAAELVASLVALAQAQAQLAGGDAQQQRDHGDSAAASAAPASSTTPDRNPLLLEARWHAAAAVRSATALTGTTGMAAAGIAASTLALVELLRGKPDRAYDAIGMSLNAWMGRDVPAAVQLQGGVLLGDKQEMAKAVHLDPSRAVGWEQLKLVAAANMAA